MKNRMKHDMKNYSRRLLAAVIALAMQCCVVWAAERDNAQWVNPMIGTAISDAPTLWGNYGGTYPGGCVALGHSAVVARDQCPSRGKGVLLFR